MTAVVDDTFDDLVLRILRERCHSTIWPIIKRIFGTVGLSGVEQVNRTLKRLEERGLVKRDLMATKTAYNQFTDVWEWSAVEYSDDTGKVPDGGLTHYESGGTRSSDADDVRFDLITPVGMRRVAKRYADGAIKHGDRNWEKGIPASVTINHMLNHLNKWQSGDRSDDHLAAVAWGALALLHYEERNPEMMDQ